MAELEEPSHPARGLLRLCAWGLGRLWLVGCFGAAFAATLTAVYFSVNSAEVEEPNIGLNFVSVLETRMYPGSCSP